MAPIIFDSETVDWQNRFTRSLNRYNTSLVIADSETTAKGTILTGAGLLIEEDGAPEWRVSSRIMDTGVDTDHPAMLLGLPMEGIQPEANHTVRRPSIDRFLEIANVVTVQHIPSSRLTVLSLGTEITPDVVSEVLPVEQIDLNTLGRGGQLGQQYRQGIRTVYDHFNNQLG